MSDKKTLTITMDDDLCEWIDKEIKSKRFATRSHAIEFAIHKMKTKEERMKNSNESPSKAFVTA